MEDMPFSDVTHGGGGGGSPLTPSPVPLFVLYLCLFMFYSVYLLRTYDNYVWKITSSFNIVPLLSSFKI